MPDPDFRALCAELLGELQALRQAVADEIGCPSPEPSVVQRARAALAQPEPAAPTDEEIEKTAAIIYEAMRVTNPMGKPYWEDADNSTEQNESRKCALAVLARYGTPANTINQED